MIKNIILDKADRLYHLPFDLEDFYPKLTLKTGEKKIKTIDLSHFSWNIKSNTSDFKSPFDLSDSSDLEILKEAIAEWFKSAYDISVNPRKEIYVGQGINGIICDICVGYIEYGDIALCPEPGLPFYKRLTVLAGGVPVTYPIYSKIDFKPSLGRLDTNLGKAAKILFLNNPNNPIGFNHDETEIEELIHIASKKNIFIVNDAAYASHAEGKFVPIRSIPGGSKVSLEAFSIPFTFGLPYIPLGFAVGPIDIINTLKNIRKTTKLTLPKIWINETIQAINNFPNSNLTEIQKQISQSRLAAEKFSDKMEWDVIGGKSAPFMWVRIPDRKQSMSYSTALLRRKKILTLPGTAFGETGDGYLRISLTVPPDDFKTAGERMEQKSV
ncbi:MAG: pyridoxal phosphate-dependent aminotransferase [Candidatus Zixiibacteriota bacterium]